MKFKRGNKVIVNSYPEDWLHRCKGTIADIYPMQKSYAVEVEADRRMYSLLLDENDLQLQDSLQQ